MAKEVIIGGEKVNLKSIDVRLNLLEVTIAMLLTSLSESHTNIKEVIIDGLKNTKSLDNPEEHQKQLDLLIRSIESFNLSK